MPRICGKKLLQTMALRKSPIRQISPHRSMHVPAKAIFACILSVAIPLAPANANVVEEIITERLPAATQAEVIKSATKVFLSKVAADGVAFVPDAVRNFVINNFDNISISVSQQVQKEVTQSRTKLGASILASIIVDTYVDYATKRIVADLGYGLTGATTAAVNEHIIRLGANIVMSGGNPADVALAQSMVLANVGVDLVEGSIDAVRSAYAADLSKIKSQYAEARLIATKRIMRGENVVDALRAYDDEIASIRDSFTLKLGTAAVRGKFYEVVDELEDLHLEQIRHQLWLLSRTTEGNVIDLIEPELRSAWEKEKQISPAPKAIKPSYKYDEFPEVIAQYGTTGEDTIFLSSSSEGDGGLQSFTATNPNTDLVNEQITEIIEDAAPADPGPTDPTDPVDPVDPPVQPTVTLRGSFSYTGTDGRTTSSQTSWRGGLVGPLNKGSDGGELLAFHLDSYGTVGSAGIVSKASDTAASFSDNLSWGRWSGTYSPGGPGACTQDPDGSLYCGIQEFTGGLWIAGTPSTSSQFALRTGTATYSGGFIGDFDNGTSIEQGKVSGNFQLNVDFGSRALTGNAEFTLDNGASVWDYASISGNLDTTQEDPMLWGTLTSTGPGLSYGSSGDMSGRFYGSGADEVAGAFRYSGIGGVASGIWAGFEGGTPVSGEEWNGFLAAKVEGSSYLFTRSDVVIDGDSSNPPSAGQNTFTTNGLSPGITTGTTKGDYTYTAWGQWNGSGVTLDSQPIEQAKIVIGRLTQSADMPSSGTRNFGGASHNSEVAGIGFNGEQIAGTISLGADFSNGHVGGQFDFTADGNQWVNGTISNTSIQGNRFFGNNNMNINQGGSGNLGGAFYGDSAQEVAGEWAIWNVPGAVSGADGVFRAKQ